jgi:hypothetical protein
MIVLDRQLRVKGALWRKGGAAVRESSPHRIGWPTALPHEKS